MKKKHVELLQFLLHHATAVTSRQLAAALSISTRSVKNYVNEINLLGNQKVILSSKQGYTVQAAQAKELLSVKEESIPQTSLERGFYIVKQIMLEHSSHMDLYDLCDALYVSYSTIKADIAKMNRAFANFHIEFTCENEEVRLHGSEKDKRRLVSYVMYEETDQQFMDANIITSSFPEFPVEQVSMIIRSTFQKYNYYINDFSFINLILHVTIMISRMHSGNHIPGNREYHSIDGLKEKPIIDELCMTLEQIFDVTFTSSEKFEIYILFKTNANYHAQDQMEELSRVVSEDILSLSHQLIRSIDRHFFVNLMSDSFLTPFALHLKNLKNRLEQHSIMKNPMLESIKISCPTIYDIATFMAYQLMQTFQQEISEDEIAFLALHVGTEIERQKKAETRVSCVILCPEYLNIGKLLYNKMLMDFGEQINIQKLISFERAIEHEVFDLLITTIPLPESPEYLTVLLPPLPMNYDKNKIMKAITRIENTKKSRILADNIDFYFNEDLFYLKEKPTGKEETINELADQMISLGYVHADFKDEVWKRERASSTAFMNIAIPHPMKMSAYKTSVAVVVCPKGMEWTNQHIVNVVFMIAFNKIDNKHFHDLYESLILLFNKQEVIAEIKKCRNFEDFKQIVIKNYIKYS